MYATVGLTPLTTSLQTWVKGREGKSWIVSTMTAITRQETVDGLQSQSKAEINAAKGTRSTSITINMKQDVSATASSILSGTTTQRMKLTKLT